MINENEIRTIQGRRAKLHEELQKIDEAMRGLIAPDGEIEDQQEWDRLENEWGKLEEEEDQLLRLLRNLYWPTPSEEQQRRLDEAEELLRKIRESSQESEIA